MSQIAKGRIGALAAAMTCLSMTSLSTSANAATILDSDLASFTVLGASMVTNVPMSMIVGNVGASPGSSITGFL